ncbi:VPEID-CTERM sorting domain-containing protein [Lutimaribacter marinistellae]|uniref:VPEID-CTERM sorting domain-containing protein n=1 Tax=Lutimaribacter marinistellae TaxID=1820329 RepID=A0ABV7TDN4_9RHOB
MSVIKNAILSAAAIVASTGAASAQSSSFWDRWRDWFANINDGNTGGNTGGSYSQVPEIDASSGLLALAAILAASLLIWEIRRRRRRG